MAKETSAAAAEEEKRQYDATTRTGDVAAAAEKTLYDAARTGDVAAFKQVLHEDPHLLERVSFASSNKTPLHIATMHGKLGIVEEMLSINPHLALDVDSKNSSPLHMAAAQGSLEIAKKLLSVAPETRWWRDGHDMNPVHIAAMKGHVEVLTELVQPDNFPAMERVYRGQTILHLCVKHGQLPALKVLVKKLGDLVNAKDDDGETVLHLAVRCHQLETVEYLVQIRTVEEIRNAMDKTPLHVLDTYPPDTTPGYSEMTVASMKITPFSYLKVLPKLTETTMVVVVLIATMAFQAAVSPPGGVWQDGIKAGEAVMASTHPTMYKHFVGANATAFVSAILTIFLLTTGMPSRNYCILELALYPTGVSLAAIVMSYGASTIATSPNAETTSLSIVIATVVAFSLCSYLLIWVVFYMRAAYLSWKSEMRREQRVVGDDNPSNGGELHWIFDRFDRRRQPVHPPYEASVFLSRLL